MLDGLSSDMVVKAMGVVRKDHLKTLTSYTLYVACACTHAY